VQDKDKPLDKWTEVYDLPQQNKIRDDCQQLVEKLDSKMENEKKLLLVSDLESIVTYYCKTK
jgi:TBC1 domain family member 23